MTPGSVEDYLARLERELRQRGSEDARIVDEAREHLVDAIESARQRGLLVEDAVRDAFERFGAPEVVAAHAVPDRELVFRRIVSVVGTVWHRRWWILTPTVLTALVTSVASYYFLPPRYRSEAIIQIVSPRVTGEYVRPTVTETAGIRFEQSRQQVLHQARLERVIRDLGLYQVELERATLSDVVRLMRGDITIDPLTSDPQHNGVAGFSVSFEAADPKSAQRVTERLSSLMIEEHLRHKELLVEGTDSFIESQIEDVRDRIIAYEQKLKSLRAHSGASLSRADLLPYEVLQERYRTLLIQAEESRTAANLERRQIGEQFKLVNAARLPERPVGPSRLSVNLAGTFAGLGLGLVFVAGLGRSQKQKTSG